MIINRPITNKLHLRHTRDRLQIRMEDRFLSAASLVVAVAVALACGVECLCEGVLLFRGELGVSEEEDGVLSFIRSSC